MPTLDRITLKGFKSIREIVDFKLTQINVLVGANGAGKSNLVDFFRMLRAMADGGFRDFIRIHGGGDGFLFNGPKETREIHASLAFADNEYRFTLKPTADGRLVFSEEATRWTRADHVKYGDWRPHEGGRESNLKYWKGRRSPRNTSAPSIEGHVYESVSGWTVYHFHDTSATAPMRRSCSVRQTGRLWPDAGNLAALLLWMRDKHEDRYTRICDSIRLVAPFLDEFVLDPKESGQDENVLLEWRQPGNPFKFAPWHLSDGTLRFICLATALLQPQPPSLVIIDEPELGQHPVAIGVLAALLHETALRTQLLICTQSPLLLDHFDPEHLVIVERRDDASVFRRLDAGALEQWLEDYSLGELTRRDIIETGPRYG